METFIIIIIIVAVVVVAAAVCNRHKIASFVKQIVGANVTTRSGAFEGGGAINTGDSIMLYNKNGKYVMVDDVNKPSTGRHVTPDDIKDKNDINRLRFELKTSVVNSKPYKNIYFGTKCIKRDKSYRRVEFGDVGLIDDNKIELVDIYEIMAKGVFELSIDSYKKYYKPSRDMINENKRAPYQLLYGSSDLVNRRNVLRQWGNDISIRGSSYYLDYSNLFDSMNSTVEQVRALYEKIMDVNGHQHVSVFYKKYEPLAKKLINHKHSMQGGFRREWVDSKKKDGSGTDVNVIGLRKTINNIKSNDEREKAWKEIYDIHKDIITLFNTPHSTTGTETYYENFHGINWKTESKAVDTEVKRTTDHIPQLIKQWDDLEHKLRENVKKEIRPPPLPDVEPKEFVAQLKLTSNKQELYEKKAKEHAQVWEYPYHKNNTYESLIEPAVMNSEIVCDDGKGGMSPVKMWKDVHTHADMLREMIDSEKEVNYENLHDAAANMAKTYTVDVIKPDEIHQYINELDGGDLLDVNMQFGAGLVNFINMDKFTTYVGQQSSPILQKVYGKIITNAPKREQDVKIVQQIHGMDTNRKFKSVILHVPPRTEKIVGTTWYSPDEFVNKSVQSFIPYITTGTKILTLVDKEDQAITTKSMATNGLRLIKSSSGPVAANGRQYMVLIFQV